MAQPDAMGLPREPLDRRLAAVVVASFVVHFGFVAYLRQLDWMREPPDPVIRLVVPRAFPPLAAELAQAAPAKRSSSEPPGKLGRGATNRRTPVGSPRSLGLLQVLGAPGEGGILGDLIQASDPDRVFANVGGVALSDSGPRLRGLVLPGHRREGTELAAEGPRSVAVGDRSAERTIHAAVTWTPPEKLDGTLPPSVVVAEIRARMGAIRACYESRLVHDSTISGKLALRFTISAAGTVGAVEVESDTLRDEPLANCIRSRVGHWHFPASAGTTEIWFPFVFQAAR